MIILMLIRLKPGAWSRCFPFDGLVRSRVPLKLWHFNGFRDHLHSFAQREKVGIYVFILIILKKNSARRLISNVLNPRWWFYATGVT